MTTVSPVSSAFVLWAQMFLSQEMEQKKPSEMQNPDLVKRSRDGNSIFEDAWVKIFSYSLTTSVSGGVEMTI